MSNIEKWDVEDQTFWDTTGKRVANRNLWISIPSSLMGFAIWLMWASSRCRCSIWAFPSSRPNCSP